jgi:hypothetical protein
MFNKMIKLKIFNYTIKIIKNKKINKSLLNSPFAPEGYVHRWIRTEVIGFKNNQGYELVKPNKTEKNTYPVIKKGKFKGYIGAGGLVLAKIPVDGKENYVW